MSRTSWSMAVAVAAVAATLALPGGIAHATTIPGPEGGVSEGGVPGGAMPVSVGDIWVVSGDLAQVPVDVPVDASGNSVAILGQARSCQGDPMGWSDSGWPGGPGGPDCPPPPCRTRPHHPPQKHHPRHVGHGHHVGSPGSANLTSSKVAPGSLPTTGANLAGIVTAALGSLGVGAGSLVAARWRRRGLQA